MKLHELPKTTQKSLKRVGRGHGSGRGKTSGRGTKGQNVRGKMPLFFEGGALPLRKRLPFLRGNGRNKVFKKHPIAINVKYLNLLPEKSVVDIETLIKAKIVDEKAARAFGVKVLGEGELTIPLTVKLTASAGARAKIEKAGGTIEA